MTHQEKNILEHLVDRPLSHIQITLRTGGLTLRETYMILLSMVNKGYIERTGDLKFKIVAE